MADRRARNAPVLEPLTPRLLGVRDGAAYLGISEWSLREWITLGVIRRIEIGLPNTLKRQGGLLRRVLVDREDLDRLISHWKGDGRVADGR